MSMKTAKTALEADRMMPLIMTGAREGGSAPHLNLMLQITAVLQTTLDVQRLIALFSQEVAKSIAHDSAAYANEELGLETQLREPERHSCSYRLSVEGQSLGEISFTRRARFSAAEISLLEHLLCALVYPLRNALQHKQVTELARKDPLTGVNNRGVLEAMLQREVALAWRHRVPLSVIFLDVDHFKAINDTLGHACGDQVIKAFVDCIGRNVRTTDIVGRYGGDEFVIVLSNTPLEGALLLAERIRRSIAGWECENEGRRTGITASLGVATLETGEAMESLLERADQALNAAKQQGRNRVASASSSPLIHR